MQQQQQQQKEKPLAIFPQTSPVFFDDGNMWLFYRNLDAGFDDYNDGIDRNPKYSPLRRSKDDMQIFCDGAAAEALEKK